MSSSTAHTQIWKRLRRIIPARATVPCPRCGCTLRASARRPPVDVPLSFPSRFPSWSSRVLRRTNRTTSPAAVPTCPFPFLPFPHTMPTTTIPVCWTFRRPVVAAAATTTRWPRRIASSVPASRSR
uniref:(northern house mosquito) hypothetical protein n=1 Tax=Culex pipiens TaxID=7175 RepID=A0A8D8FTD0_CULPI